MQRESSLPFVIGSAMLLFGGISVWLNVHALGAGGDVIDAGVASPTVAHAILVAGVAKAVLHVFAGLRAVTYRPDATRWALIYAGVAIAVTVFAFVAAPDAATHDTSDSWFSSWYAPAARSLHDDLVSVRTFASIAWPLLVAFVMTRPRVRIACQAPAPVDELPRARLRR